MYEWSIIVHGGAKEIKPEDEQANRNGVATALRCGATVLENGGSAMDAVEQAVRCLEDDKTFNAGSGAAQRSDGSVQMDAALMDGETLNIGAIAAIQSVKNPISVARAVFKEEPILLVGQDATDYARKKGFEEQPGSPGSSGNHDTVGCVARDIKGNIVVGVSTGGLEGAVPGRVGDSALPGCGFFADNTRTGLCMSGEGETIARVMLAAEVVHNLETMNPQHSIDASFAKLARVDGEAGCILIDSTGNIAWNHNSSHFAVAHQHSGGGPEVYLMRQEVERK